MSARKNAARPTVVADIDPSTPLQGGIMARLLGASCRVSALLIATSLLVVLCLGTASAAASADIEGVWSFNGGEVDIQAQPDGSFRGVVVSPTKFALCVHPVNEEMWTGVRAQLDGSYWGLHRWYFEPPACLPNPTLGPTAWRVLRRSNGSLFLRVCFSAPGSGSQPTIAVDGSSTGATYGCADSAAIAPLPPAPAKEGAGAPFKKAVILPPNLSPATPCGHVRSLKIALRDPKYDPLKEVVVWVNGRKVADVRSIKKLKRGIRLTHLPSGAYTVKVLAITVLNHRLRGGRSYGRCTRASSRIGLHGAKRKRHRPHG